MNARLAFLASFLGCIIVLAAPAGASMVSFDSGVTSTVGKVLGQTSGAKMSGMSVTFDYLYGGRSFSQTVVWKKTGRTSGGAFAVTGAGGDNKNIISLVESGKTNAGKWVLKSVRGVTVEDVVIETLPGNSTFDVRQKTTTPGSGRGRTATSLSISSPRAKVGFTYSDLVMLEGSSGPVGDLYSDLQISFSGKPVSRFSFLAGTAAVSPLPAPPGLVLISSGLLWLFALGKLTWTWSG
ncbi:MAG: hypothetical protein P4L55_09745 [Syntrophobacteraceae bacterium]|nr:hypothetical protein [Syntrophobacteraceae bacterium]